MSDSSDSISNSRGAASKSRAQLHREQREKERSEGEDDAALGMASSSRESTPRKERREKKKPKAQLQREQRELEKAAEEAAEEEKKKAALEEAKTKKKKKDKEVTKPKAVLQREQREIEKAEEEEQLAEEAAAKKQERAERKAAEALADKRSAAQKHREEREIDKSMGGTGLVAPSKAAKAASSAASAAADYVANSKSKTKSSQDAKDGLSIFEELANEEDATEVAEWFLTQMGKLSKASKDDVENLPLYKLACANNAATDKQRQTVAKAAIAGYGSMEPERRAKILNFVVKSASVASSDTQKGGDSKHVANLLTVVKAARFDKMPEDDKHGLLLTVQSQALQFAAPQHLSEGLSHMRPEERKELAVALAKTKIIPEDKQALVQDIVKPDGILEEAGAAASTVNEARDFIWCFIALPFLEWFCARRWLQDKLDCAINLNDWMLADSRLSLATIMFFVFACRFLGPAYDVLSSDPVGTMRRWEKTKTSRDSLSERLLQTFRIDSVSFRIGCVSVSMVLLLTLFSAVFVIRGLVHFILVILDGCIEISAIFIGAVLTFRFGLIAFIVYMIIRVFKLMTRHKMVDANDMGLGYGSFQDSDSGSDKV